MVKSEILDSLLKKNNGFLKTSDVVHAGISRSYLGEYVEKKNLKRIAHGLYMSPDAWEDDLYVMQTRYPQAVFSHETALYLLDMAEREPLAYALTLQSGVNATALTEQGIRVYKVKKDLVKEGLMETRSPAGHTVRTYNPERTICDLVRSRSNVEIQDLHAGIKAYILRPNLGQGGVETTE